MFCTAFTLNIICIIVISTSLFSGFVDGRSDKRMDQAVGRASVTPRKFFVKIQGANRDVLCGGTIISRQSVLTAAHCFDPAFESGALTIHYRDFTQASTAAGGRVLPFAFPKNVIMHEHYNFPDKYSDIAIINFDTPVFEKQDVLKLCPKGTSFLLKYESLRTCGMGLTSMTAKQGPVRLMETEVFEDKNPGTGTFKPEWKFDEATQMLFTTHGNRYNSMNFGDSGNPIFAAQRTRSNQQDEHGMHARAECLYGVVNNDTGGTRVAAFVDWIKQHMKM